MGVNTNTGSPSFNVSFIASASNIDSLVWSFPGGKTNDSVSEINETVTYEKFGKFDVGLEVFNAEDTDKRYYKDFIDIFYKDNLDFRGVEATSWNVTGTSAVTSDFQYPVDSAGKTYESWITIPYTSEHIVSADKNFENFPSNGLTLEFEYKIEKVPVMYITESSITGTSISSPSDAVYVDPLSATSSDTKINISSIYPGTRRFLIKYNGITMWVASSMTDNVFKRASIDLPSLSSFSLNIERKELEKEIKEIPYSTDPSALNTQMPVSTITSSPTEDTDGDGVANLIDAFPLDPAEQIDTDGDGIGNNADNDDDGDKYLDVTETTAGSDPLDKLSIPNYYVRHSTYPYILSIRNMTIKLNSNN
ncbi:MAG: hypothetical protein CBD66_003965 [Flavobacteriaceae bacterium TMED206]|nr:MAG: hypothetical protein CBD66_003965 [Flavobacteriaceae bacterium TMED206]